MRWALVWVLALAGCPDEARKTLKGYRAPPPDGTRVEDPVTGEACDKTPLTEAAVYRGHTFYFCSDAARRRFGEAPDDHAYR